MDLAASLFPSKMDHARAQKRRPATYGKARTSNYTLSNHAPSPMKPNPPSTKLRSPGSIRSVSPARSSVASNTAIGKLKRPSPKRKPDVFDVPSSDDERVTLPILKRKLLSPAPLPRSIAAGKPKSRASSRDSAYDSAESSSRKRKRDAGEAEAQLLGESGIQASQTVAPTAKLAPQNATHGKVAVKPKPSQAVKLAARPKSSLPVGAAVASKPARTLTKPRLPGQQTAVGALKSLKGVSAPALLEQMVAHVENDSRSRPTPALINKPLTSPKRLKMDSGSIPRTPTNRRSGSPASVARTGSLTPRQHDLWSRLLDSGDIGETPSKLAVQNLRISGTSKSSAMRALARSTSDVTHLPASRRGRLIDTLARPEAIEEDDDESLAQLSSAEEESFDLAVEQDMSRSQPMEVDAPVASSSQGGPRLTYGQARTYIEENNLEAELLLDSPIVVPRPAVGLGFGNQKATSQTQSKYSQGDEDLEDGQGPIKSVHELRAAGGNKRFVDDFENMLEDIRYRSGTSMSRPRAGIMDLCEKLSDKKFVGRMLDHGLDEQFLKACSGVSDTIFNFAVAVAIAFIADADAPVTVLRHIQKSDCFDSLFSLLNMEMDIKTIAKERKTNMSKVAQTSLDEFRGHVLESSLWPDEKPITLSTHVMALKTIDLLVRNLRQKGHMEDILDEQKTATLLTILERRLKDNAVPAGTDLLSLELSLSTLEFGSIIPGRIQTAWTPKRLSRLAAILPKLLKLQTPNAEQIGALALRLMLNLTNNHAKKSEHFAEPELVRLIVASINERFQTLCQMQEAAEEELAPVVDRVILSLGAIINLAEFCDSARVAALSDPTLLDSLACSFSQHHARAAEAESVQATQFNVAYGWLAVALGNLCLNKEVSWRVAQQLPGDGVKVLVSAIEEFVVYHRRAKREEAFEGEEGGEASEGIIARLREVAEKLKGLHG